MRLMLINPRFPESFWSFKWAVDTVLPGKRAINPPLGLATLAALAARHLEHALRDTRARVSLRVDRLHERHARHWRRLLRRLARYGDRVEIVLDEALRRRVSVDSSVFTLRLDP